MRFKYKTCKCGHSSTSHGSGVGHCRTCNLKKCIQFRWKGHVN